MTSTNSAISTTALPYPRAVSVCTVSPLTTCLVVKGAYFVPYCRAASTSMGAVVATATKVIHPEVKLARCPNAIWGKRTTPPESGYITPSSAYTRAISRMRTPPSAHETTAAGPASLEAFSAPNSHPEPMMDPTLAKSSPTTPT